MKTHLIEGEPKCPECGSVLDAATAVGESAEAPSPGDVTVCAYCADILEFTPNGFDTATLGKFAILGPEVQFELRRVQQAIRQQRQMCHNNNFNPENDGQSKD